MRDLHLVPFYCLLAVLVPGGQAEIVLGEEREDFDFDGLPGAIHEFKINIKAGDVECFYQKIMKGGRIIVRFEVLKGGDGNTALYLSKPTVDGHMSIMRSTDFVAIGGFQFGPVDETWGYAICLDNTPGFVAKKLVHVYIATFVDEEWAQYKQEIEGLKMTVGNFSATVGTVRRHISMSLALLAQGRMHVVRDWYKVKTNMSYVQWWSIAQCVIIVVSSVTQVFVLRRLFRTTNVTPTMKPRA